jgi:serine/threonine protein kinase
LAKDAVKEWNNLQMLSKEENHPHLMVALGAYWHGNQFFILQEEAELSLHHYLKGEGDEFESEELWKQMKGVADGLTILHKLYKGTRIAYHQDLKPANILIMKRRLKIADFGLLELKPVSLPDDAGSTGVLNSHNTGYYAAPRQGKYTRDSDIWSLGCIMSELATCDIQGRHEVENYKEARIANSPSGKDTPRFFSGQVVKDTVLKRHSLLCSYVQSDAAPTQFQKEFYTKEFFGLLNSMFKHMHNPTDLLERSSVAAVPDAGHVAETIERLRKGAVPTSALDNRIENLSLEQHLLDTTALNSSLEAHLTDFNKVMNRKNRTKFPATTLADLKQYIVNLQAKQHEERRQQGLTRLSLFLERFEQFGELIKSLPRAMEFMGFIWVSVLNLMSLIHFNPYFRALRDFCSRYD